MISTVLLHIQDYSFIHSISMSLLQVQQFSQVAAGCTDTSGLGANVSTALNNIVNFLTVIGAAVCAIGVAIGGLMRATSFGSERRISDSNTAISCAIVGLLVVLLSQGVGKWIGGIVPATCSTGMIHLIQLIVR